MRSSLRLHRAIPLLWALAPLLLAACASDSTGTSSGRSTGNGTPTRILLRDYRTGTEMTLVNDAWADRLEFYSSATGDTNTKFLSNADMNELVAFFNAQHWSKYAQQGSAPRDGANLITSGLEIERGGSTSSWKIGNGSAEGERKDFIVCKQNFILVFSQIEGFQAVKNPEGKEIFKDPLRSGSLR